MLHNATKFKEFALFFEMWVGSVILFFSSSLSLKDGVCMSEISGLQSERTICHAVLRGSLITTLYELCVGEKIKTFLVRRMRLVVVEQKMWETC